MAKKKDAALFMVERRQGSEEEFNDGPSERVLRGASVRVNPLETTVLLAVALLDDEAYAPAIHRGIYERTGRDVSLHSIYVTLGRLEKKLLVTSEMGEPSGERGGRSKRFYRITNLGRRRLEEARTAFDEQRKLWASVARVRSLV